MDKVWTWLTTPLGSAFRVFLGLVVGGFVQFLQNGGHLGTIHLAEFMTWVEAALVVAVPLVIAWINPADPRFGNKTDEPA